MEATTTKCPLCGQDAETQSTARAYCVNADCAVLTFNPQETLYITPDPRRPWRAL